MNSDYLLISKDKKVCFSRWWKILWENHLTGLIPLQLFLETGEEVFHFGYSKGGRQIQKPDELMNPVKDSGLASYEPDWSPQQCTYMHLPKLFLKGSSFTRSFILCTPITLLFEALERQKKTCSFIFSLCFHNEQFWRLTSLVRRVRVVQLKIRKWCCNIYLRSHSGSSRNATDPGN